MTRIVAGALKGRRLATPPGRVTRPTTQRFRAALFDILTHRMAIDFCGLYVLDLFAGSGALGIESLSRGARFCVFVDKGRPARCAMAKNITSLGLAGQTHLLGLDAADLPGNAFGHSFDLVFLDPPYGCDLAHGALAGAAQGGWLGRDALVIIEAGKGEAITLPQGFDVKDERVRGGSRFIFAQYVQTSPHALPAGSALTPGAPGLASMHK